MTSQKRNLAENRNTLPKFCQHLWGKNILNNLRFIDFRGRVSNSKKQPHLESRIPCTWRSAQRIAPGMKPLVHVCVRQTPMIATPRIGEIPSHVLGLPASYILLMCSSYISIQMKPCSVIAKASAESSPSLHSV